MKREFLGTCLVATMLAAGPATVWAQGNGNGAARPFSFAAIGDVPYSSLPSAAYDALIAKINADPDVAFSVHIGDIKTGDSLCADSVYSANLDYFNKFAKPLIFSPGDNEWTDCHRANNGGYNPDERLSLLRNTFFQHNKSLGQSTMPLFKDKAPYVENSKWEEKPAMFIALHQPGSNNNRNRTAGPFLDNDAEYTARNASNMEFLDDMLKKAKLNPQIKLVVIASQANPFERYQRETPTGAIYAASGYADFITKIRAFVVANPDKRVLYINGDTHTARFNQPLTPLYPSSSQLTPAGTPYPNFHRLEVYAQTSAFTTWYKVNVNTDGTFSVTIQTAP